MNLMELQYIEWKNIPQETFHNLMPRWMGAVKRARESLHATEIKFLRFNFTLILFILDTVFITFDIIVFLCYLFTFFSDNFLL